MIEVEMSKDIRDTPPKIVGPFSKRQLIAVTISCIYGVPIMMLIKNAGVDIIVSIIITIVLMAPTIACGWVTLFGIPLEKFVIHILKTKLSMPGKRVYESENLYLYFMPTNKPDTKQSKTKKGGQGKK